MGRKPTVNTNLPPRMRARVRGKKTYYFFDAGGKPRKEISLGTDYVEAVRRWSELEQTKAPTTPGQTFDVAATNYVAEVLPTKAPRTRSDNVKELGFLREFFAGAPLDDIEPTAIRGYFRWRAQKARQWYEDKKREVPADAGHVRANREIALFSHIFNYARESGLTSAPNPAAGVKRNSEDGRDVYVEDDVFAAVYKAADAPTRDAMDLAYLTGQRPADTLKFDERNINGSDELEIQQGKTKKKLRIAVEGELAALIERIRARKRGYKVVSTALVVNESGQRLTSDALRSRFDKARAAAGIDKDRFQFRDLRAKAGTDKTDSAGDIRQAQQQLGHSSVVMTERYVRQRRGDKVKPTR
ncbi:tyrosine-type recombinase/integrase [Pandoraea apista]|uniref:tyrosine-type recombinase/integrase n=1 Tax=Pandoraea apista TaxID=93218 RepID=UPI000659080F|nr:tyrosine-type recombinase/integrase [Pandoraea apista]ALS64920.1 integrase [Pandoraea apista]CFB65293.1 Tyrosine recombinase XerC [Pandoraea apista]